MVETQKQNMLAQREEIVGKTVALGEKALQNEKEAHDAQKHELEATIQELQAL